MGLVPLVVQLRHRPPRRRPLVVEEHLVRLGVGVPSERPRLQRRVDLAELEPSERRILRQAERLVVEEEERLVAKPEDGGDIIFLSTSQANTTHNITP